MAYRARNILIAVALAAVAALLTSFYVTSYKRHVQRGEDHVTVLVAKQDIAVGASGADVAGQLSSLDVPRKSVVPGAISSADQLAGLVATEPTLEGEQVTTRRFSPRTHVGVRAQLERHAPGGLARGRPEPAARRRRSRTATASTSWPP